MLSKRVPPLPPKSGSITFLIFYEGGKGGCPAAGGKGEHFCVPAVLSCDWNATDFSFTENSWRAGKTGGVQKASLCNDCFSRKQAGHKAEGAANCFAPFFLLAVPGATGLPVLALLLALLSQCPRVLPSCFASCELSSICKQSGSE